MSEETNPVGRPTKFKPEMVDQAKKLCLLGATEAQMADFFQVSIQTLYTWRETYPDFLEAITQGKIVADAEIASALWNRAKGYTHKAVKIMVVDKEAFGCATVNPPCGATRPNLA
jgi:hypothetical protein